MRLQVKPGIGTFLLMSFTFGYCDAITFFTSGFLSGHVLANVILAAYQIFHNNTAKGFLTLLSIPLYLTSLLIAIQLFKHASKRTAPVKAAGIVLMVTGLLSALLITVDLANNQAVRLLLSFLIVVAMGIIVADKYGSTSSFNVVNVLLAVFFGDGHRLGNQGTILMLVCFSVGCVSGAAVGNFVGLSGVILPGVLLLLFTMND